MLTYDQYQRKITGLKTAGDVTNFAKELIAPVLQTILEEEMTEHLGYSNYGVKETPGGNSRNGHSPKTLRTSFGEAPLAIPRDRNGEFTPQIVPKHTTIQSDVEEKIIAMYGKGMTTRDINGYLQDIYGIEVSSAMVSSITDTIIPQIQEWQSRPLDSCYPVAYLDGIHFKVRQDGRIVVKCAYLILGITGTGHKELLGIWIGKEEGAKFWMGVLSELQIRGVKDLLIICTDGLTGFDEAIRAVYPQSVIQQCIVHQVRNTLKFIPHKDRDKVAGALKSIYTAPTESAGLEALSQAMILFPQYSIYLKSWEKRWHLLSPFFQYPAEIRRIIYTTNAIEALNRQLRKVTKTTTIFPHDQSLMKLLYLAASDITRKWNMPIHNWGSILAQLTVMFPEKSSVLINS